MRILDLELKKFATELENSSRGITSVLDNRTLLDLLLRFKCSAILHQDYASFNVRIAGAGQGTTQAAHVNDVCCMIVLCQLSRTLKMFLAVICIARYHIDACVAVWSSPTPRRPSASGECVVNHRF